MTTDHPVGLSAELSADVARAAGDLAARLEPFAAAESDRIAGHLVDVPGRGQTLVPPAYLDESVGGRVRGHVTFGDV